jgi:chorismate mutase
MNTPPELDALRALIDQLDLELLDVLGERRDVVKRVSNVKRQHGLPPLDPGREATMRAALVAAGRERGVPEALVTQVLDAVLADSHQLVK